MPISCTVRDWSSARVIVTGGTGFIGSHLVRRLAVLGTEVHSVSRQPGAGADRVHRHRVDLTDPNEAAALIADLKPQVVFHMAGLAAGSRAADLVLPTLTTNLQASVNVMTAMARSTPSARLVLAGSLEECRPSGDPAPSPYAASKIAVTEYAQMFARLWSLPVCVLRVAMAYGPAQPDITKLVPYVTYALLRGDEPKLSGGSRLIDWVYVEDVVDAFVCAADTDRSAGTVIDIGSGEQVSVRETVTIIAEIIGVPIPQTFGTISDRPFDYDKLADTRRAADLLHWQPQTSLSEGLRRSVAWYSEQLAAAAPSGAARDSLLTEIAENDPACA